MLFRSCNGAKLLTEAADALVIQCVVGERSVSLRRRFERTAGDIRSANADMSNVKAGEKPARRKPKDSCSTFIGAG